jgi:hypothetical protein
MKLFRWRQRPHSSAAQRRATLVLAADHGHHLSIAFHTHSLTHTRSQLSWPKFISRLHEMHIPAPAGASMSTTTIVLPPSADNDRLCSRLPAAAERAPISVSIGALPRFDANDKLELASSPN